MTTTISLKDISDRSDIRRQQRSKDEHEKVLLADEARITKMNRKKMSLEWELFDRDPYEISASSKLSQMRTRLAAVNEEIEDIQRSIRLHYAYILGAEAYIASAISDAETEELKKAAIGELELEYERKLESLEELEQRIKTMQEGLIEHE